MVGTQISSPNPLSASAPGELAPAARHMPVCFGWRVRIFGGRTRIIMAMLRLRIPGSPPLARWLLPWTLTTDGGGVCLTAPPRSRQSVRQQPSARRCVAWLHPPSVSPAPLYQQ
jgi:hypothetical protein